MKTSFSRVVIINLKRRADRRERLTAHLAEIEWPFAEPVWFDAVDASLVPTPPGWTAGGGAWGCMQSHRQVLERAIMDGVESLLVLEDDVFFAPPFFERVKAFLAGVPDDWEQVMLGGQYVNRDGSLSRKEVAPGVELVSGCERTHAYAVRGPFMRELYAKWCAASGHCDHVMGPFQKGRKVYAPTEFLAGQAEGKSDISGADNPPNIWVKPPASWPVTLFVGTPEQAKAYRETNGKHSGHNLRDEVDIGLTAIMEAPEAERIDRLRAWVSMIEWEGRSKTPERQCMIYGVPEKLCRDALGDRLVVEGVKKAGCCGAAMNALSAVGRVASAALHGGEILVEPSVKVQRHDACLACEHLERGDRITPHRCSLCACFIGAKTALATESCPVGKWGAVVKDSLTTAPDVHETDFVNMPVVFWHVAAMNHWREIAKEQLDLLAEVGMRRVRVTFVGTGLKGLLDDAAKRGVEVVVEQSDPNIMHYETLAMLAIERWAKCSDGIALYFHTKGASAPGHDGKRRWRHLMQEHVIRPWRENMGKLVQSDVVGCNWRNLHWNAHFAGNFWMARAEYLRTLPDFAQFHGSRALVRFNCESWIGQGSSPRVVSLAHRDVDYCAGEYFGEEIGPLLRSATDSARGIGVIPTEAFAPISRKLSGKRIAYISLPGNWGDRLIDLGARRLFLAFGVDEINAPRIYVQDHGMEGIHQRRGTDESNAVRLTDSVIGFRPDLSMVDYIVIAGGGSMGGFYKNSAAIRKHALSLGVPVIVMPSTFTCEDADVDRFEQVFLREYGSLSFHSSGVVVPDCALALVAADVPPPTTGTGTFLRLDQEARFKHLRSSGSPHSAGSLHEYLVMASRPSAIVTDCLHFAIAGALLGRDVTLLPGTIHKNRSVWDAWLRDVGVKWANSP